MLMFNLMTKKKKKLSSNINAKSGAYKRTHDLVIKKVNSVGIT